VVVWRACATLVTPFSVEVVTLAFGARRSCKTSLHEDIRVQLYPDIVARNDRAHHENDVDCDRLGKFVGMVGS
jgi:hypothetical protein